MVGLGRVKNVKPTLPSMNFFQFLSHISEFASAKLFITMLKIFITRYMTIKIKTKVATLRNSEVMTEVRVAVAAFFGSVVRK